MGGSECCWAVDGGLTVAEKEEVSWDDGPAPEEEEEGERGKE